ncbi:cytochrome P450 monooxygenase-like protein [Xylaria longipes]|nr:cytochrome P450 monooxygenase-like protein [Xylaria longipes]
MWCYYCVDYPYYREPGMPWKPLQHPCSMCAVACNDCPLSYTIPSTARYYPDRVAREDVTTPRCFAYTLTLHLSFRFILVSSFTRDKLSSTIPSESRNQELGVQQRNMAAGQVQHLPILAVAAGVVVHNGIFRHGEWHLHGPHIIASHLILGGVILCYLSRFDDGFTHVLGRFALLAVAYLGGLFSSMTIYRLYFHRLSSFHGPRLAAVTKLWHVWHVRDSTNFRFQEKVYKEYGSMVRTGPNEITVFNPAAFELLDGFSNETTRDVWYDIVRPRTSAVFTRDRLEHKEGRKFWAQGLSNKAMNDYYPRMASLVRDLSHCIGTFGTNPVDIDQVMSWYSWDVMGEVLFGEDFNLTKSKVTHPGIKHRDRALALAGPLGDAIWIALLGFQLLPPVGIVKDWHNMIRFCEDHMKLRFSRGSNNKIDMATYFIEEYQKTANTKTQKARDLHLAGTAVTAVVAGSDTTRAVLVGLWWFLSKYPEHAKKLQSEVDRVDVNDANALAALPHLNGAIYEALRLIPPVMTGGNRITGPNGMLIDDVLIPPGVKVTCPKYVLHRMDSMWVQPNDFVPERWYSRPELILDKRAFAPFSYGARYCLGKNMAINSLRLVVATLLQDYNASFAPGYDEETIWRDMKDQVTCQPGAVFCVFHPRKPAK